MKNLIYCPITRSGNLLLAALPIEKNQPTTNIRQPVHHIFAIDKSGSMYSTLPRLIEDLKIQVRFLQKGDAITFAWFSSRKEFGFPIKAFRIVDESSFDELDRLFDEHKEALNLTCFSEVLGEVGRVLDETKFLDARNCLTFFSDGWANDASVSSEHAKCREILKSLNGRFDLVLTVAYSDYADRAFLAEMASLAGGECVSSARLHQFTEALNRFFKRAEFSVPRIKINFEGIKPEFIFGVDRNPETGGVSLYEQNEQREIYFAPTNAGNKEFIYFLLRDENSGLDDFLSTNSSLRFNLQDGIKQFGGKVEADFQAPMVAAAYAASVVLSQKDKQDEAIEVLGYLGDKNLVQNFSSAYTPSEKANVEEAIRDAVLVPSVRWQAGREFNCTPRADAFCLLDLLNVLASDPIARFHPRHPAFKYKKIGRSSKTRDGYSSFIADAGASSSISDFVWNSEYLNLSVRARITGTVSLPESVRVNGEGKLDALGLTVIKRPASLPEIFPTFRQRTYTLVKDGFLNVQRLPVSVSPETALELTKRAVFDEQTVYADGVLGIIELSRIPIINRLIAQNPPSAEFLAKRVYADEVIGSELKVLKALRDELDPKKEIVNKTGWSIEEQRFLLACGFASDGSFAPPEDKLPATDYYEATCFKISVKGFSSLPKLSEVRDKLKAGKSLNAPAQLMNVALSEYNQTTVNFSPEEKIRWIDASIASRKRMQAKNRLEIQKPKFAMVLGHKSFTDVSLSDQPVEVAFDALGSELTAKVSITKKQIEI